jgi:hypothetical protein
MVIYGLWIQSGAIFFSAIGVIGTLFWQKRIACRRATLDILLSEETDPRQAAQRTEYVRLRDAGHLAQWANPEKTASDESAIVRAILNRYELVAIGIRRSTIDEKSYKSWCRTTLVKDWIASKPFIMQLRQNAQTPTYFCEFEAVAKKWATSTERPHI